LALSQSPSKGVGGEPSKLVPFEGAGVFWGFAVVIVVLASADIPGSVTYKSESWVSREGGSKVPLAKAAWRIWVARGGSRSSRVKVWVPLREAT